MTRTNKAAAASPAPENGNNRRPLPTGKAGPVRTVKAESGADLTDDAIAALLANAMVEKVKPARAAASPRVTLTAEAAATFAAMGWNAPRVDHTHTWKHNAEQTRFNECKGSRPYTVAVQLLQSGPLTLETLGRIWLRNGNEPAKLNAIAKQLANRAGCPVQQIGDRLQLVTA
jgi:hypothetical protein